MAEGQHALPQPTCVVHVSTACYGTVWTQSLLDECKDIIEEADWATLRLVLSRIMVCVATDVNVVSHGRRTWIHHACVD